MAVIKKTFTLCVVHEPHRVLLGMKKRGFGEGKWNGFGGKLVPGESIEAAARRELLEEVGLTAHELVGAGVVNFHWTHKPDEVLEVYLFRVPKFAGEPLESEEMRPAWFDLASIPFDTMWPDDRHWLPLVLAGKTVRGRFLFNEADEIAEHELEVIDES